MKKNKDLEDALTTLCHTIFLPRQRSRRECAFPPVDSATSVDLKDLGYTYVWHPPPKHQSI
jgi:hypothetical protein